jgi:hypothetical protein
LSHPQIGNGEAGQLAQVAPPPQHGHQGSGGLRLHGKAGRPQPGPQPHRRLRALALAEAPHLANLEALHLDGGSFRAEAVLALRSRFGHRVPF